MIRSLVTDTLKEPYVMLVCITLVPSVHTYETRIETWQKSNSLDTIVTDGSCVAPRLADSKFNHLSCLIGIELGSRRLSGKHFTDFGRKVTRILPASDIDNGHVEVQVRFAVGCSHGYNVPIGKRKDNIPVLKKSYTLMYLPPCEAVGLRS